MFKIQIQYESDRYKARLVEKGRRALPGNTAAHALVAYEFQERPEVFQYPSDDTGYFVLGRMLALDLDDGQKIVRFLDQFGDLENPHYVRTSRGWATEGVAAAILRENVVMDNEYERSDQAIIQEYESRPYFQRNPAPGEIFRSADMETIRLQLQDCRSMYRIGVALRDGRHEDAVRERFTEFGRPVEVLVRQVKSDFINKMNIYMKKLVPVMSAKSDRMGSKNNWFDAGFVAIFQPESLIDLIHAEIFFVLTSDIILQRCANPTCNLYFATSRNGKLHCTTNCAGAHRQNRHRKKKVVVTSEADNGRQGKDGAR